MASSSRAFSLGYSLHIVGTYFDGAAMIAHVGAAAESDLKTLCTEQLTALANQGAPTRFHIRRVDKALAESDLAAVNPPQQPDDYPEWVDKVLAGFYPKCEASEETLHAYSVGWYLGSWIENANLAAIALLLKDAEEDNTHIAEHLGTLQTELSEAAQGFEDTVAGVGLGAEYTETLAGVLKHIQEAPPLNDPEQEALDIADDYQEVLYELGVEVEKLEKSLGLT
jgi:hypothetical protein